MSTSKKRHASGGDLSSAQRKRWRGSVTHRTPAPIPAGVEVIEIPSRAPSPSAADCSQLQAQSSIEEDRSATSPNGSKEKHATVTDIGDTTIPVAGHQDASAVLADPPRDVCFGLLLLEASYSHHAHDHPLETAPVRLSFNGNMVMLRYESSGGSAGLVISEGLSRVARECSVTLVSTVMPSKVRRPATAQVVSRQLRVVVYGLFSEMDAVTKILDGASLFLQSPDSDEYDRRMRYHNPMYLLRPGQNMPRIGGPSVIDTQSQTSTTANETDMGEINASRVLRIFDEASRATSNVSSKVKQSRRITSTLKDHQIEALAMMIEKEEGTPNNNPSFPSLWEEYLEEGVKRFPIRYRHIITGCPQGLPLPNVHGGILADEMGLGKTLSTLSLVCHHIDMFSDLPATQQSRTTRTSLIVTPKSTIHGWQQQIERHIRPGALSFSLYHGSQRQEADILHEYDVVFTTYETLRSDWASYGPLYTRSWARIILDEAHKIRNRSSRNFYAACEVPAHSRWCLTGTPIQNSLDDFGSLLAFIGVPPFTTHATFKFWVSSPILGNQQHSFRMLRKLVRATCMRRTKTLPALSESLQLPTKTEQLVAVELTQDERNLYDFFKRRSYLLGVEDPKPVSSAHRKAKTSAMSRGGMDVTNTRTKKSRHRSPGNIIVLLSVLRMICDHGEALLPPNALEAWRSRDVDAVSWTMLQTVGATNGSCCMCGQEFGPGMNELRGRDEITTFSCKKHSACEACVSRMDDPTPACPNCLTAAATQSTSTSSPSVSPAYRPSSKVSALLRNILPILRNNACSSSTGKPVKSIVFSLWTGMLDLISAALDQHLCSLQFSYVRIDGGSTLQQRRDSVNKFNSDEGCTIMLATIGAVGEGVDLSVASEAHIVEPHWNPMVEAQAVDRVHRIGQTRKVKIYKYCARKSVEEYIRWIQNQKLKLINESFSSSKQRVHSKQDEEEDLMEERWKKLLDYLE